MKTVVRRQANASDGEPAVMHCCAVMRLAASFTAFRSCVLLCWVLT